MCKCNANQQEITIEADNSSTTAADNASESLSSS